MSPAKPRNSTDSGVPDKKQASSVDTSEVLELAAALIRIESHRDAEGREASVGRYLSEWLTDRGIPNDRQVVSDERANIVARIEGSGGPSLMLNGHLDTVPAGEMPDAFKARVEDGRLVGRGACDMKGAVAAMAGAVAAVQRSGTALTGDLVLAATVDEETGSLGVGKLVEHGILTDYAIVGEPTSMRIGVAHKGVSFVRITLHGRAAHGSRPDEGVNAAVHAARLVCELYDRFSIELADRTHKLLGPSTINVGRICGGSQPNIVADHCEIDVDRRTVPGESDPAREVERIVAAYVESAGSHGPDGEVLTYSVQELPESAAVPHPPLETASDCSFVAQVQAAAEGEGLDQKVTGLTYWTDGAALSAAGVETVVLGPGNIEQAHGPDEWAPVSEIESAARMYYSVAALLLEGEVA